MRLWERFLTPYFLSKFFIPLYPCIARCNSAARPHSRCQAKHMITWCGCNGRCPLARCGDGYMADTWCSIINQSRVIIHGSMQWGTKTTSCPSCWRFDFLTDDRWRSLAWNLSSEGPINKRIFDISITFAVYTVTRQLHSCDRSWNQWELKLKSFGSWRKVLAANNA